MSRLQTRDSLLQHAATGMTFCRWVCWSDTKDNFVELNAFLKNEVDVERKENIFLEGDFKEDGF